MVNPFAIDRLVEKAAAARQQGDKPLAADLSRQAADLLIEAGDYDNGIRFLFSAATLQSESGDPARAEATLRHALTFFSRQGVAHLEPQVLFHLAELLIAQKRAPEAIPLLTRIITLEEELDMDLYAPEALERLHELGAKGPHEDDPDWFSTKKLIIP